MKQYIDDMIARRVHPPASPFQPKNRISQRMIVRQFSRPDVAQSAGGLDQRIIRQHVPVIPITVAKQYTSTVMAAKTAAAPNICLRFMA